MLEIFDPAVDSRMTKKDADTMADSLPTADNFELAPNSDRGATIRDEPGLLSLPPEAQAAQLQPHLDPEDSQRYSVGELVGSGATSQVFSATDMVFDRQIAIKFMANDQAGAAKRIARFIREAKLTAALEHPNVAPIYDLNFAKGGAVYFTMRMVKGTSLGDAIRATENGDRDSASSIARRAVATPFDQVNIILRVCDAVECAHGRGILHRDIKPDNIMLGGFGEVMLVDWGSALLLEEREFAVGHVVGTPNYMSPEQACGHLVDHRSDIYALGASLFHVLTGNVPTVGTDVIDFWHKKRLGIIEIPTPGEGNWCPVRLMDIVLKAMAVDPADRYQHVAEFAEDLRHWQAGLEITAHHDTVMERFVRWHHRHWRGLWSVIAIMAVMAGSAAIFYNERLKEQSHWGAPLVVETFENALPENRWLNATGSFEVKDHELIATNDDESTFFFNKRLGGDVAIEYDARYLPGTPEGDVSVMWSEKAPQPGEHNARFSLQIGAGGNFHSAITETGKGQLAMSRFRIDPKRQYHIRMEISPNRLSMRVDGEEICACDLDIPTGVGYVGLYAYSKGKAFDNIRIFSRDLPERISCLGIGDRDLREGEFARAAEQYQQVAITHAGKPIESEALYRQGFALYRGGDFASARTVWAKITDPKLRRLSDIQKLFAIISEKKFKEVIAGIHQLMSEEPALTDRLLRVWTSAAQAAERQPLAVRQGLLDCFYSYFSNSSMGVVAAAGLMQSMDRHEEVLQRFAEYPEVCMTSLLALGRADEIAVRYPTARNWQARAMMDQGLLSEVMALAPPVAWAERQARTLRGEFQHVTAVPESGYIPGGVYLSGLAEKVITQRPDAEDILRAMVFCDHLDQALTIPVVSSSQRNWRQFALALSGKEEVFRDEMSIGMVEGDNTPVPYWLVIRMLTRGDHEGARRELANIHIRKAWYENAEIGFSHAVIAPFIDFLEGDRDGCAHRLAAVKKGVMHQRLWYAARYILGEMTDSEFLQQPVVIQQVGFLGICQAMRAEWEGRSADALHAYRAYLALPPHQRLAVSFDRDPVCEAFAGWRIAALSAMP